MSTVEVKSAAQVTEAHSEVSPRRAGRWREGYTRARHGLRNYWYPALFSEELAEGGFRPRRTLGENLLFNRVDGTTYAVADRCVHHPVRLSAKPGGAECHAAGTMTCWCHGFTYDVKTGGLCAILTQSESPLIGRASIHPVEERQGLIFVWIGDEEPGPIEDDVPPGFLGDDHQVVGILRTVASNWRLSAENGFDRCTSTFTARRPSSCRPRASWPLGAHSNPRPRRPRRWTGSAESRDRRGDRI